MDAAMSPGGFAPGVRVLARGLVWDVIETDQLGAQTRLHLRCVAGDMHGLEWDLLHPAEPVEVLRSALRPETPGSLAAWRLFHIACLLDQAVGPTEMLALQAGRVQLEPYQLVPLMRALELPRPRLLLADGVGLGKTIEAGLIAVELIARRQAHRVVVVAPPGPLLLQWEQELRQRFGLRFTVIANAADLLAARKRIELGGNPFDSIALCLVSLDFAKQEHVLEELERASWDLAIIDEAHHCIGGADLSDREDTLRRRLAEVVARRSDGLLLLTATPHDGYDPHFASLIELLDPSLVDGGGGLSGSAYRKHVVRRLKSHIRDPISGVPLFHERRVIPVRVEGTGPTTEPVRIFHRALGALVAPRLQRAMRSRAYTDALAFVSLLKRSVSTIEACVDTLRVICERYLHFETDAATAEALRKERARALRAYRRRALRYGTLDAADEDDTAALEADEIAADLVSFGAEELTRELAPGDIVAALATLIRLGEAAAPYDPKLSAMLHEVREIRAAYPATNILVYTEYADSQLAALRALRRAHDIEGEVLAISGLDPEPERARVAECCAERDGIILISTDSMAEGLNLQRRCFHLIHLDLPYNPNRLEQRNGRIDRYGQMQVPQIRYLYLAGTFEERLLLRLIAKYEKARARLSFMPETLGVTADEAAWNKGLVAGFAEEQAALFPEDPPAIRTLDQVATEADATAYRELLHEIDRAFAGYERSAVRFGWLVSDESAVDTAPLTAAAALRRRSDALLGHTELLDFVTATIALVTGLPAGEGGSLRLPADWAVDLDGLPGFDAAQRLLRVTHDPAQLRDAEQHALACLGRAHPLVQRAIARARGIDPGGALQDSRVAAACADAGMPPSVLLTFSVEMRSASCTELQRLIAVLLPRSGSAEELREPAAWLARAEPQHVIATADLWRTLFAGWYVSRYHEADTIARDAMTRIAGTFAAAQRARMNAATQTLTRWLTARADDICGRLTPRTGDLFDTISHGAAWLRPVAPCDRLAAYALDAANPTHRRREANTILEVFQRRCADYAERAALSPPTLRPLGLLMLVPSGVA